MEKAQNRKVLNANFFKSERVNISLAEEGKEQKNAPQTNTLTLRRQMVQTIRQTVDSLQKMGFPSLASNVQQIYKDASCEHFTVSIVGEFSRGKSTLINNLLNLKLPVQNLPTTALLTKICYGANTMMTYYGKKGNKIKDLPLTEESWTGLTANNFNGNDPQGFVIVKTPENFLGQYGIEIIDTPGAGDLDDQRMRATGDVLQRSDGAIITTSAIAAMSMSEKVFIDQRVLSRKIPFVALAITKLDLVPIDERKQVVEYVKNKLKLWNINIPVIIPAHVEMLDDEYADIMGLDKLKALIISWVQNPRRARLTEQWLVNRVLEVVDMAEDGIKEQQKLVDANDEKRRQMISEKKAALSAISLKWDELKLELRKRSVECYKRFVEKEDEFTQLIIERLQYEASHAVNPQKWWNEDYPYRIKIELTNMATALENVVTTIINNDARWFNNLLQQQFKTYVQVDKGPVSEKRNMADYIQGRDLGFENLNKKRNYMRIGTTALSIAGATILSLSGFGFLTLIATLGVGTGASIVTEGVFKNKIEDQRKALKSAIAKQVPQIIANATNESEARLKAVYDDLEKEVSKKQALWMETQNSAIDESNRPQDGDLRERIAENSKIIAVIQKELEQFA